MEAKVFDTKAKEVSTVKLPESIFGLSWNADLVHQVVRSMQDNARTPVAHVKDRSDVRGGGRKPWKQKGTGRARHGSRRSPIWVGGGVTHGPSNERSYAKKVNKKMKTKALYTTLAQKNNDGEIIFIDKISFKGPKTADAKAIVDAFAKVKGFEGISKKHNALFIAMDAKDENTIKSFNNFGNVEVNEVRNLNPLQLLNNKFIVIVNPEEAFKTLEAKTK